MVEQFAKGENYEINLDKDKNRLYLKMEGDIYHKEKFEKLPEQMREACKALDQGFTCLADFTKVKLFALPDVAGSVQEAILEQGVRKVASIWGEQLLAKMAMNKSADSVGDDYSHKRKIFTDRAEGEAWLDET
jgi:hypothetical protein